MGDRNSDNYTRGLNKSGLASWEYDAQFGSEPSAVQEQGFQPQASHPASKPMQRYQQVSLPDTEDARQRVSDLEQQSISLDETVQAMTDALKQTRQQVAEQERQLKQMKQAALEQKKQLAQKQEEQKNHQRMLETARRHLSSQENKRKQAEQQQLQQASQLEQGYGNYTSQPEQNILSHHRETPVTTQQARVAPLPGDYQPPGWCYQRLQQHEGIPLEFAQKQLEDFKMYWLSTGEARKAWDYRFMKHVIYQWRREKPKGEERTARSQPTTQELTDRSWADRYDFDFD